MPGGKLAAGSGVGHGNGRYRGNLSIRVAHDLPRANFARLVQFDLTTDANVATMKLQRETGQVAACAGGGGLGSNAVRLSSFALSRELVERSKGEWALIIRQAHDSARTANQRVLG